MGLGARAPLISGGVAPLFDIIQRECAIRVST